MHEPDPVTTKTRRMSDLIWLLAVGAIVIGCVAVAGFAIWRAVTAAPEVDLQQFARRQGLIHARGAGNGWVLSPAVQGENWKIEFHNPGSVDPDLNMGGETIWTGAANFPEHQAIFLAALPPKWLRTESAFNLMQFAARLGNTPLSDLAGRASMATTADSAFDALFSVVATDASLARQILKDSVRRRIQTFVDSTSQVPRIIWSPGRLTVRVPREVTQESTLKAMMELGQTLATEAPRPQG